MPTIETAHGGARNGAVGRNTSWLAPVLSNFSMRRPDHVVDQRRALDWIAEVHAAAESTLKGFSAEEHRAFELRIRRAIDRCACSPAQIGSRGHAVPDIGKSNFETSSIYDVMQHPHGRGAEARSRCFASLVSDYFDAEYQNETVPPTDLIHVTCTGYVSPSGAQQMVAKKGWGDRTRVTHAYQMGCYAAFPAIRLGAGALATATEKEEALPPCVDIVHTELCSLHLDPGAHSLEQLVVQSLFGDGFIRYSMRNDGASGLRLITEREVIIPDSADCMSWTPTDFGMQMTLARDVPDRITAVLGSFVARLWRESGRSDHYSAAIFAVHPGGPRILDRVREVLELDERQVQASRDVLFDYGNMSSATLPHVWMRILSDDRISPGTPVVSLAFGPGLTVCGALFEKV